MLDYRLLKEAIVASGGIAYLRDCITPAITKDMIRQAVRESRGAIKVYGGVYTACGQQCVEADSEPALVVPESAPPNTEYALGAWRNTVDPWGEIMYKRGKK